MSATEEISLWVIYKNPADFIDLWMKPPGVDYYVVRRWETVGPLAVPKEAVTDLSSPPQSLEAARAAIPNVDRLTRFPRDRDDQPTVVEVWL